MAWNQPTGATNCYQGRSSVHMGMRLALHGVAIRCAVARQVRQQVRQQVRRRTATCFGIPQQPQAVSVQHTLHASVDRPGLWVCNKRQGACSVCMTDAQVHGYCGRKLLRAEDSCSRCSRFDPPLSRLALSSCRLGRLAAACGRNIAAAARVLYRGRVLRTAACKQRVMRAGRPSMTDQ